MKKIRDFEQLGQGLFLHFGLYSLIGRGEWLKHTANIPDSEYEPLILYADLHRSHWQQI